MSVNGARATVWTGAGFVVQPEPWPDLRTGELLVEVELATICGSDLHTVDGHRPTPVPTVLGHEAVGRVVAAGPGAPARSGHRVGDRVVWSIGTACGSCDHCRRGLSQKCRRVQKYGHEQITDLWRLNGAFASHVHLLAGTTVVGVPEDLPAPLLAPAGCATATVVAAARRLALGAGDAVVVVGCGMLGLTAVAYARDRNATSVVACDVDASRREQALALGADVACPPDALADLAREHGADVVLELSGHPAAVRSAIEVADVGGRVALVGSVSPGPDVPLDANAFVRNLTTLVGSHNYAGDDLVEAVAFLSRTPSATELTALVSGSHRLDDVEAAFRDARTGRHPRVSLGGAHAATRKARPGDGVVRAAEDGH